MSEWDWGEEQPKGNQAKSGGGGGRLNAAMTVCCLLTVAAVSLIVALWMKDRVRNLWEMGLTYSLPFAALLGTSMLVEHVTGKMTPQTSRKAQLICAGVTVLVSFLFGCLTEAFHQPVLLEKREPEYDYVLVLDRSGSTVFLNLDDPCRKACHQLIDDMEDENRVGIVAFGSDIRGSAAVAPLDAEQRKAIHDVIDVPVLLFNDNSGDGTNFTKAMDEAMRLIGNAGETGRPVRIILVTDGDQTSIGSFAGFNTWAKNRNGADSDQVPVELCAIQIGPYPMLQMVKDAVSQTGGKIYDGVSNAALAGQLQSMKSTMLKQEPVDTLKATYEGRTATGEPNTPYMIMTCVMLILLGVLSGLSLKTMYSVEGQRRAQVWLSPVMGLMAFLLLNFGRHLGVSPAWCCEALAFSLFGLVFMRENRSGKPEAAGTAENRQSPAAAGTAQTDQMSAQARKETGKAEPPQPVRPDRKAKQPKPTQQGEGDEWSGNASAGSSDEWM